jgi:hypothetical protein
MDRNATLTELKAQHGEVYEVECKPIDPDTELWFVFKLPNEVQSRKMRSAVEAGMEAQAIAEREFVLGTVVFPPREQLVQQLNRWATLASALAAQIHGTSRGALSFVVKKA